MGQFIAVLAALIALGVFHVICQALTGGSTGFSPGVAAVLPWIVALCVYSAIASWFATRNRDSQTMKWYRLLYPENGPGECAVEGCSRKCIRLSGCCAFHHHEAMMGCPPEEESLDISEGAPAPVMPSEEDLRVWEEICAEPLVLLYFYNKPNDSETAKLILSFFEKAFPEFGINIKTTSIRVDKKSLLNSIYLVNPYSHFGVLFFRAGELIASVRSGSFSEEDIRVFLRLCIQKADLVTENT